MKLKLAILSLILALPLFAWAALPFTDTFTGTNGTALGTYSANWTVPKAAGNFEIQSNAVQVKVNTTTYPYPYNVGIAYNNSETYSNDQYAKVTLTFSGTPDESAGPAVRVDANGQGYYVLYNELNGQACLSYSLDQGVNGISGVGLSTCDGTDYNTGDELMVKAIGTTISIWKNGTQTASVVDTTYSAGKAGLAGTGTHTVMRMDSFEGGNIGASSTSRTLTLLGVGQ